MKEKMDRRLSLSLLSVIAYLVLSVALADAYYEVGQKPAEKTGRAQLLVRLPSTLEPATYVMEYALGYGRPATGQSALTWSDDAGAFTAGNGIFSVAIDKATGTYSLSVGGTTVLSAYSRLVEGGNDHYSGRANPAVVASGPQKLTLHWNLTDSRVRIEHFLTIYGDRPEILVQQRVLALGDLPVTDLELDRFLIRQPSLSSVYSVKASGEYDGAWGASFPKYEPWVSAYGPTGAIGLVFDSPTDSIDTTLGREVAPHERPGRMGPASVITRNAYIIYSDSKHSARDLWLKKKGLAGYSYAVDWDTGNPNDFVEQAPSSFQFAFVKPEKYATLSSLKFNVTYADYPDASSNLTCFFNDNLLFNRQTYNNTPFLAEFPYRWLNSGTNSVRCRALGSNSVGITQLNLTIASMYGARDFWGWADGWMMPITISGLSATGYSAVVAVDYLKLGLGAPFFNSSSFRLVNEGGYEMPMNVSSRYLYFPLSVPACCGSARTLYLLFSQSPSTGFFSDVGAAQPPPVAQVSGFGLSSAYGILVDAGVARPLNPQTLYMSPPSKAGYVQNDISPGVETESAKKFVFDPKTGRGAVLKLMVWRKA